MLHRFYILRRHCETFWLNEWQCLTIYYTKLKTETFRKGVTKITKIWAKYKRNVYEDQGRLAFKMIKM